MGGTPDAAGHHQAADFKTFFQNVTKQQLSLFLRKFSVWCGTVSPNDLLYIPSGSQDFKITGALGLAIYFPGARPARSPKISRAIPVCLQSCRLVSALIV